MYKFEAILEIIGINPFVSVPENILIKVFKLAGKDKGHIPITGTINDKPYKQTLIRYSGAWRLYINTSMLKNSPKRIGEKLKVTITFDPEPRTIHAPVEFIAALNKNTAAKSVFDQLPASRKLEIVRYLANLKTIATLDKNINKAINFLLGKERFVGRDKP